MMTTTIRRMMLSRARVLIGTSATVWMLSASWAYHTPSSSSSSSPLKSSSSSSSCASISTSPTCSSTSTTCMSTSTSPFMRFTSSCLSYSTTNAADASTSNIQSSSSLKSSSSSISSTSTFLKPVGLHIGVASKGKRSRKLVVTDRDDVTLTEDEQSLCGEDAFFFIHTSSFSAFGVADGVGGWADRGVNAGEFAWCLMENCKRIARNSKVANSSQILIQAYEDLIRSRAVSAGSSTACVLALENASHTLSAANLGDSGFMIVRDNEVVYRSSEQQHFFNAPYQCAALPEGESESISDHPSKADKTTHQVNEGDLVIVATDGLFDNVFDRDILSIVRESIKKNHAETEIAHELLVSAWTLAGSNSHMSPFAAAYSRASGRATRGGKVDDITVLVARVVAGESKQQSSL